MEWFKKKGNQIKVALGVLLSVASFFLFMFIRGKLNAKSKLNYELERIRKETEMANLEEDFQEREMRLSSLRQKEKDLREKLKEVEAREYKGEEVSVEEIDDFFRRRGLM